MKRIALFLLLGLAAFLSASAAAIDWPSLQAVPYATGFDHPTYVTSARDGTGRLFVVEHPGRILVLTGTTVSATPFLDISSEVQYGGEQGLLSMAFPPSFATTGRFYVAYSRTQDGSVTLSRFTLTANPDVADPASEQVLLAIYQTTGMHNGGQLQFGPDGYLYLSRGDGGPQKDPDNNAQKENTLLGKILRLDVESAAVLSGTAPYGIPKGNPYVGKTNARPEIWARGLRNPWRFSFDRQTGDLYLGDVGQDTYEEADFQPAGQGGRNYGWRLREGFHRFNIPAGYPALLLDGLTPPISERVHPSALPLPAASTANAAIGGYVYRGTLPANQRMAGIYFYGDFNSGKIWGVKRFEGRWITKLLAATGVNMSSFGEDESGELYLAQYSNPTPSGLFKLQDSGQALAPTILPDGGAFKMPKGVLLHTDTPGATLRYTLTGVDPAETDPAVPSTGKIILHNAATLKVRAFRSNLLPSDVTAATFSTP